MATPEWKKFAFTLPGKDYLTQVRSVMETLVTWLEVLKAILETVKTFLVDFGNPIKVLVEALIKLIVTLLQSLQVSGFYAWYHSPNPFDDPSFKRHQGGFPSFAMTWKGSLHDTQDRNRPQPLPGSTKSGYILIVADTQGPTALLDLMSTLLKFFGRSFTQPVYPAPTNVKCVPVGTAGDPILQVTQVFQRQVKTLAVEWALPSNTGSGDPAFSGLPADMSKEFYPPQWLVERSARPIVDEVEAGYITDWNPPKVGYLVKTFESEVKDPRTNKALKKTVRVVDESGEPVLLFENAFVVNGSSDVLAFVLGQLGTFRFIDNDVVFDKTYYYRVRAFSGGLKIDGVHKRINYATENVKEDPKQRGRYVMSWPSTDPNSPVVMGKPSGVVKGRIVQLPADFDVISNLRHIFASAFSFNFHLPLPAADPRLDPAGKQIIDADGNPQTLPQFDDHGDPIPPLDATVLGLGTLTQASGVLSSDHFTPTTSLTGPSPIPSSVTGRYPDMPWVTLRMRYQVARLATQYAAILLAAGSGQISSFRSLMQGPLPEGTPTTGGVLEGANTLEKMVFALTAYENMTSANKPSGVKTPNFGDTVVTSDTAKTYGTAFYDPIVRKNVLAAVNFVKTLGYQGQPPDWERINLIQDLIPWSGQMLYEMLGKVQGLLDAYKGVMDEIKAFISLIERKIETLEAFIQFLISILNYVEQFSAGFYLLSATGLTGSVDSWTQALDSATGTKPPSQQGGYTGGICLGYVAPDVTAFEAALKVIF